MENHLMQSHQFHLIRILPILLAGLLPAGCAAQDQQQLQAATDQANATLTQAKVEQAALQKQLTTLPADDPTRKQLEPQLARLEQVIAQIQSALPLLDAAIKSTGTGQIDPSVQQAVSAIPYGTVALALASILFGIIKHVQAANLSQQEQQSQKAFAQIVTALDTALPAPTAEQQAKVEGALDSDVKAKLAAARAI
jgi:hypothetical protein